MSKVYLADQGSKTTELVRFRSKDENLELQQLLFNNPDLMPGDQIDPDEPRRWLLIKREMSVASPASGGSTWAIDFFFVDQDGIPTLVECKRREDTSARRQVVGQMLEYAANGHAYWDADDIEKALLKTHGSSQGVLAAINTLTGENLPGIAPFISRIVQNLRDRKLRLVFFLDESPHELRSVVEFLSSQMKDVDVFLVEARQYVHGNQRVVAPWLFGFTEETRVAKSKARNEVAGVTTQRGEAAYWAAADVSMQEEYRNPIRQFQEKIRIAKGVGIEWHVSCIITIPSVLRRGLFAIQRSGALELYLFFWHDSYGGPPITERQREMHEKFLAGMARIFDVSYSDTQRKGFPYYPPTRWLPLADQIESLILDLASTYSVLS